MEIHAGEGRNAWDDNKLMDDYEQWEAEYERYHSISVRGENVEDVLNTFELEQLRRDMYGDQTEGDDEDGMEDGMEQDDPDEDYEPGELHEGPDVNDDMLRKSVGDQAKPKDDAALVNGDLIGDVPGNGAFPDAAVGSVQNDALENLKMAWYWAGYYTALNEVQRGAGGSNI